MSADDYSLSSSDFHDPLVSCPGGKPKVKGKKTDITPTREVKQSPVPARPITTTQTPVSAAQQTPVASIEQPEQEFRAFEGGNTSENEQNYTQDDVDDKILYLRKKWVDDKTSHDLVMMGLKMLDNWIDEVSK